MGVIRLQQEGWRLRARIQKLIALLRVLLVALKTAWLLLDSIQNAGWKRLALAPVCRRAFSPGPVLAIPVASRKHS